jgi:serine protease Do
MANRDFGEVAERLRRSTVQVSAGRSRRGNGSGIIWSTDGVIVTNAHVAETDRARVELWDGREFEAGLTARDTRRDLASLRIAERELPAITTGDSSVLRPGELVLAVGNPLGFIGALTTGVVHALGPLRGVGRQPWVQAAVRLAPGNSGGPLANARGEVIGVNTMIAAGGLALAVPSDAVQEFLRRGGAPRPALGVTVRRVPLKNRSEVALMVLDINPGGPAASASILIGDLLLGASGQRFENVDDLADAIEQAAGGVLVLQFTRGDHSRTREVAVWLQARSAEAA